MYLICNYLFFNVFSVYLLTSPYISMISLMHGVEPIWLEKMAKKKPVKFPHR